MDRDVITELEKVVDDFIIDDSYKQMILNVKPEFLFRVKFFAYLFFILLFKFFIA